MFKDNKTFNVLANIVMVLLIVLLFTKVSFILNPVFNITGMLVLPLIISIFLYYAIKPLLGLFKKARINKSIQIILVLIGLVVLFSIIFYYGGSVIKEQLAMFLNANKDIISNPKNYIEAKLIQLLPDFQLSENIIKSASTVLGKFADNIGSILGQVGNFGTQMILVPFILFYFLRDDEGFAKGFLNIIPVRYKNVTKTTLRQIDTVLSVYISGQLLVALVIGVLMYIGYLFIGMPNATLMAFFSLVTSVIPLIGPFLGIIPAILLALTIDVSLIVKILIVAVVVQQVEGSFITPNIVGNKLKIHPLAVMLIVIISVSLFGFMGAFIGIPMYVSIKVLIGAIGKIFAMNRFQVK